MKITEPLPPTILPSVADNPAILNRQKFMYNARVNAWSDNIALANVFAVAGFVNSNLQLFIVRVREYVQNK
jgi:hypothetical protein